MAAPILPIALGAAFALWTLYESQRSKEQQAAALQPPPAFPPVPLMPGAAPFLPPIAAPEPVRNAIANALFAKNPVALRTLAQNLKQTGFAALAAPLLAQAEAFEHPRAVAGAVYGHRPWRGRIGDDLELLARTAGVEDWPEPGVGASPPIYVGALRGLRRRNLMRRLRRYS